MSDEHDTDQRQMPRNDSQTSKAQLHTMSAKTTHSSAETLFSEYLHGLADLGRIISLRASVILSLSHEEDQDNTSQQRREAVDG